MTLAAEYGSAAFYFWEVVMVLAALGTGVYLGRYIAMRQFARGGRRRK